MEIRVSTTEMEPQHKTGDSLGEPLEGFDEMKMKEVIAEGKLDFDGWTSLILEVESSCSDELKKICFVYDSFLFEFPLCYGYWRKYAEHMIRLCTVEKAVQVFERAVQAATYSVGVWVDYCGFAISVFQDADNIRRLFKRATSFVGKDYLCHALWDKYIEFEFSEQQWSSLANVYIQTLRFPSKKLHLYYESFQKLVATWKEDMQCLNDLDLQSDQRVENEVSACYTEDEISCVIKDLMDPSAGVDVTKALEKYLSIGKHFYREASQLDKKIHCFESSIRRPYFHAKPLDISQLENWHEYLNFVEMHGDFDWAVKLYERCLIPCANYPEFWMRYVDYMESKGGREIAHFALDRATQIFLKRMPVIHLFSARFKEKIRDVSGAHVALLEYETESDLSFVETVSIKANMEKRLGNFVAASNTYKEAVEIAAAKEKFDILPILYIHFSRLEYMVTNNSDAARDILIEGIKRVPHCKLLFEELINFGMMQGGPRHIHALDTIINDLITLGLTQGMSAKEAEEISSLYLQFVDLCGTIDDIRKAWKRHIKSFPDSARMSAYMFSVKGIKPIPLKMTAGGRQESLGALPSHPSGDGSFDVQTGSPPIEKRVKHSENDDTQPNHAASDSVLDKKSPIQDNHEIPYDLSVVNRHQSGEIDESLQEGMQDRSDDVSKHLNEDTKANSKLPSPDSIHEVTNEAEVLQTSEEKSKESYFQQEHDHQSEQDLNHLSLERLSLDQQSLDSNRFTNQEVETVLETSLSNGSLMKKEPPQETSMFNRSVPESSQSNDGDHLASSPRNALASDSAGIQTEMASPSSSASQPNIKKTESLSWRTSPYGGRSWHQSSNSDRGRRENNFGFRRHSHKRPHQRRQLSPERQYPRSETVTQVPVSQGYPSQAMSSQSPLVQQGGQTQNQYSTCIAHPNSTAAYAWCMHNMQQQNFVPSQPQPLPPYPQPQISQHPMQSNQQLGEMQNNQAYNQMWQYYFYQQQQQQQPQNQHQPQQQLLQQQYHQQQQMLQVQQQYLQQQQLPYQHPQLLQLQQQQQQQQQHQLIQQQGFQPQQLPPQNNHLNVQQQQEQEQRQREGQITTSQVQIWNDSSKEAQGKLSHRAESDASEIVPSAVSPNSQQPSSPSQ